jgi:hypothetical protein
MYAILPDSSDFIWEADAEYFEDCGDAIDSAYDWSAELGGWGVILYKETSSLGDYIKQSVYYS